MKIRLVLLTFFTFCMSMFPLLAQSTNISCATALELPDVTSYCSGEEEFDSDNVGESEFEAPTCWSAAQNDLWFTFIATNKSINIIVSGVVGSMDNPEIALYKGEDCTFLTEINCEINENTDDITSLFESNLIAGERYYLRVDGRSGGNDGTFQLCTESYNPPITPGQDCNTASILCSKESFVVQSIEGSGAEPNEADGSCLDVGGTSENNSTWFKWTCSVSGTLTMDLVPLVITDDYDFAIWELVGDIESCERIELRCSATDGGDLEPCGPNTGLDLTSTDTEEDENCDAGEDGYVRFLDLEAGKSYAMLINNFSDSDAGFNLSFGGTAEFEGPTADFEVEYDDCGPTINVTSSSVQGSSPITVYEWDFGTEATPATQTGPGPHAVEYPDFGLKTITLRVESELGCQIFYTEELLLEPCNYMNGLSLDISEIRNIGCGGADDGFIEIEPSVVCGTYEYSIDGEPFQTSPMFDNLSAGNHTITIRDELGCMKDSTYTITEIADFSVDAGEDVTIQDLIAGVQLNASTTATGDVTISWDPSAGVMCPDGTTNCLDPIINIMQETTFTISVTDENGCTATDEIVVAVDLCANSDLQIGIDSASSFTCLGENTGYVSVGGVGGTPDYEFSINEGPFTEDGEFENLGPGLYIIQIQDQNFCTVGITVEISEVADFDLEVGPDVTFDLPGESHTTNVNTTASSNALFQWSPTDGLVCPDGGADCLNPTFSPTVTTTYILTIIEESGCVKSDEFTIIVPDVCANSDLGIQLDSISGEYCNGARNSFLAVSGNGGFPDYLYSIDGGEFDTDSIFEGLPPGSYRISIQDRFSCSESIDITVEGTPPFTVDAGRDVETNGTEPFPSLNGSHTATDDVTISWSPASGIICSDSLSLNCTNPIVNPEITTTYTITVTDALGCIVTDEVTVRVVRNENVYGPNIFTPNEDGINDVFTLQADPDIVEIIETLTIFDRWGNKVYDGRNLSPADPNTGWNGAIGNTMAEQGVYVWFATIKFFSRSGDPASEADTKTVKGDVALIR